MSEGSCTLEALARYKLGVEQPVRLVLLLLAFIILPFFVSGLFLIKAMQWECSRTFLLVGCPLICTASTTLTAIVYKRIYRRWLADKIKEIKALNNQDSADSSMKV